MDLIVLGTHGQSGLGHLLMGSVAEQVVRKAPCPVLTLKTPGRRNRPRMKQTCLNAPPLLGRLVGDVGFDHLHRPRVGSVTGRPW